MVPGCESKEQFEPCEMSDKMKADCDFDSLLGQCEGLETDCYASCAVVEHPQCLDGPCLIYQYREIGSTDTYKSTPFCTLECGGNAQCPEDSECLPFLDKDYCIPLEHIQ